MEADTEGAQQPKQDPIEEVDEPIEYNLYSSHKIEDELVIGPVVLQKPDTTYVGVNNKVADRTHHSRPSSGPDRSEQSENSDNASLTTQPSNSAIKVELEVLDDMTVRDGSFGEHMTSEDWDLGGTGSDDGPGKLEFAVDVIKVEVLPTEAYPDTWNGEEDPLATNHKLKKVRKIARKSTITPFSCNICNKQFNFKGNLKTHLIVHTKEKRFSCDFCDKQFSHKSSLNKHVMVHEKPFSCRVCRKEFSDKSNLRQHLFVHNELKSHHATEKPAADPQAGPSRVVRRGGARRRGGRASGPV